VNKRQFACVGVEGELVRGSLELNRRSDESPLADVVKLPGLHRVKFSNTFGQLVNASKQSLIRKNLTTTTHRQVPRKTTINLGRRAIVLVAGVILLALM
jgi:hypothetical protein